MTGMVSARTILFVFFVVVINGASLRRSKSATDADDERLSRSRQRIDEPDSKMDDPASTETPPTGCARFTTICTNDTECANMCGRRGPGRCLPDAEVPSTRRCYEDRIDGVYKDTPLRKWKSWLEN